MFELLIQVSMGVNHILNFATSMARVTFSNLLQTQGAVMDRGSWVLPTQVLQSLRDIGWLRDKPSTNNDVVMEVQLPYSLLPMGYTPSAVIFSQEVELRKCSMPTILQAILGYLAFETTEEKDIPSVLGKIKALSAGEAGKEFSYGKWQGQSLIQAIEQAYRYTLDSDAEALKDLLDSGNEVLQYQTAQDHEDIVLGVAKLGKNWQGKNLIGHVLMALRHEYGGEPDPRLELIRGYREYSMEELQPGGDSFGEIRDTVAELQAQFLLGDAPSIKQVEELVEYNECVTTLKGFILDNDWWPFPMFQGSLEVVLIEDGSNPASSSCPEPFLQWLCKLHHSGAMTFIGAEIAGWGDEMVSPVNAIDLGEGGLKPIPIQVRPYDAFTDALKVTIPLGRGAEWWAWYISEQSAKLAPSQLVKLFTILAKLKPQSVQWTVDSQEIHFMDSNEFYTWNFATRGVDARQYRKAFKNVILNDKPVSSNFVLLWLALRALNGFKGLNGVLSSLANLWEREANYGVKWEDDHPTRLVRDNSWAPLGVRGDMLDNFGLTILNGQFNNELFLKLISSPACRHDAYTDKNGSKVLAGNGAGAASLTSISYPTIALEAFDALDAGVNPMLVLALVLHKDELFSAMVEILSGTKPALIVMRKFGLFVTLNDGAKMPKFLNRAQQGASWNEALVEVEFQGGVIKRSPSLMTIQLNYQTDWVKANEQDEIDFLNDILS
jgi:hypothetical protein